MDYKKFLRSAAIGFIGVLIFLTFFSRTLLDLQIPRVSLAFAQNMTLRPEARSSGIVVPADTERIFAPVTGRITQILQRGDMTNADTVLFAITSDLQTLQDLLQHAEHDLRVNSLAIEQTTSNRADAQNRLYQLQNQPIDLPNPPMLNLWEFDVQLDANAASIQVVEADIATLVILLAQGIVPRQDIVNREADLERLLQTREEIYTRREIAEQNYETAVEDHNASVASAQRMRTEHIQAQQNIINGHNFALANQNLDRERIETRLADLQEQIEMGGVVYVQLDYRPIRRVTEISPGLDIGSMVSEGMPVMTTSIRDNNFIIQAYFPQTQDFIGRNQNVEIQVGTNHMTGTTTNVVPDGARNLVYIEVNSNALTGGELAHVTVAGGNFPVSGAVPLSALREDTEGYYVFFVVPYARRLGSDYIVQQTRVNTGRRDSRHIAISVPWGSLPDGPIVVNSDMPVSNSQRVRLVAGHDIVPTRPGS